MGHKSRKVSPLLVISATAAALMALAYGTGINALETTREFIVADLGWCSREEHIHSCRLSVGFFRLMGIGTFIGAGVGSVALTFSHKMSRRTAMMISNAAFIVASVITACTVHFAMLFVGRMLMGFAFGFSAVALLFLIEVAHPRWRSWFTFIFPFFVSTGFLVTGLWQLIHGRILVDKTYRVYMRDKVIWRGAQLMPGIFALLSFAVLFAVSSRTPYELVERGMTEEAMALIKKLNEGMHNADLAHEMLEEFERDAEVAKEHPNIFLFEAMYTTGYLKPICIVFILACGHQVVGPAFFSETAPSVFADAMGRSYGTTFLLFCLVLVNFAATLGVAFIIRKVGRRTLMLAGTVISTLFMFFALFMRRLGNNAKWAHALTVVGYFGFTVGYAVGLGGLTFVYLAEVFPTQMRNTGFAFCVFVSWTCARIVLFFIEYVLPVYQTFVHILLFVISVISVFHVFLFVRETKDVPLGTAYHGSGLFAVTLKKV
ncbi:uncharacterized protein TOT_020000891 [Theileria orientalis strain Shintoku]|uniref:Major facilitator superfamily (MFS) profile domain-containing protein n=1 Tax=Theileria orientalis strain Shintoku TaxID=869250 RepID=J4CD72_THEOR|nr:uncharacterized protein TOT_020000891 [Theileria orientalis strain Shintoku]BAM40637.1 uncharacterized protein TOT_020000891 [Theileria orientalis strain Shintoku]|eukprot:XP_009690938.1 uncharacterized protein TOT_020000891 [Theileria orientalis strain Shintoku]